MISHALTDLFTAVAALSWRASWLILVLAAVRMLVRGRIPAQLWFVVWILVAARLLLPFSFPTSWSPYNFFAARLATQMPVRMPATVTTPIPVCLPPSVTPVGTVIGDGRSLVPAAAATCEAALIPFSPPEIDRSWSWLEILAFIWIAGAVVLAGSRMLAWWRLGRIVRNAPLHPDARIGILVREEIRLLGGGGPAVCVQTDAVDAPALFGFWRPRLLFPPGLAEKLTAGELRLVVRHELGHWRRRDLQAQGLMQAALVLHWFNPLAWLAARLARTDCELACDEFVLRRETDGRAEAYGSTLLKVFGAMRGRRRPVAVVAMLEGREQLKERVRMIAGYRATTAGRVFFGVVLVAGLALLSLTRESRAEDKPVGLNQGKVSAEIPLPAAVPRTVPGLELTLMPIPSGTFTMGSPGRRVIDWRPRQVTISKPFWLGRTEVTQGQWKALMGTDVVEQVRRQLAEDRLAGRQLSRRDGVDRNVWDPHGVDRDVSDPHELVYNTADDAPMYWVSWEEAVEFCRRLTERERAAARLPSGYEYRLPTEAEWEYAARAGTTTATYAGELEIKGVFNAPLLDPIAWYGGNSSEGYTGKGVNTSAWREKQYPGGTAGPHAVATKRPNAWGLYDMLGNVWEWCEDWWSLPLPGGSVSDPKGPAARNTVQEAAYLATGANYTVENSKGAGRVIRGGSWSGVPHVINAVGRTLQSPGQRENALGFRVALAPQLSQ